MKKLHLAWHGHGHMCDMCLQYSYLCYSARCARTISRAVCRQPGRACKMQELKSRRESGRLSQGERWECAHMRRSHRHAPCIVHRARAPSARRNLTRSPSPHPLPLAATAGPAGNSSISRVTGVSLTEIATPPMGPAGPATSCHSRSGCSLACTRR